MDSAVVSTITFCMKQSPWIKIKLSKKKSKRKYQKLLHGVCKGTGSLQGPGTSPGARGQGASEEGAEEKDIDDWLTTRPGWELV